MVSVEAAERAREPLSSDGASGPWSGGSGRAGPARRSLPATVLTVTFLVALVARLLAHDLVITADEDNWMRRAGGFTFGILNGQLGRTYQNGHPGVTTMWVAMLTLGPRRMVQYADRVHNQRLVGRVPGFWDALVDARPGFALATALLVALIAGLAWRVFGGLVGALTGLLLALEPFYLAISQLVHMDALLSGCMVASVLALLVRWARDGGRIWLVVSGILAGLAILSKVPAIYLFPFTAALGAGLLAPAWLRGEVDRRDALVRLVTDGLIWGAATAGAFALFWPAVWVLGPAEVLGRVAEFTKETGGQPHEQGTFFWGQQTADPGPFFYPVAMAFRLAPITLLGLALAALCWRQVSERNRPAALALVGYGLGFLLMMTLGAKKLDRYVLPIFPALCVLAALGLAAAYSWLHARMATVGAARGPWRGAAAALVALLTVWPATSTYPYFLTYYNPLLGGGPAAQRLVMVGNGEGLDQVATWLNAQPNAQDQWVVSHSFDILQALIVGSGESLRDRVPGNADWVVLYRFQIQIGHSPRVLDEYLNRRTPEHVVWINGVEYARIYRGPHQQTTAEGSPLGTSDVALTPRPPLPVRGRGGDGRDSRVSPSPAPRERGSGGEGLLGLGGEGLLGPGGEGPPREPPV
ncbi:MAG: glycosyltransferase family 39 protein [Chloroflexi bacterium]|nr:glycosyltransferase family 39 protein [Chloroflexota bacterium]